jgi:hypothetical protein
MDIYLYTTSTSTSLLDFMEVEMKVFMNIAYKYSLQTYFVVKTEVNYDNDYGNHNLVSEHSQNIETLQDWEEKGGCLGEIHFVLV